jgi:hypothetical protein
VHIQFTERNSDGSALATLKLEQPVEGMPKEVVASVTNQTSTDKVASQRRPGLDDQIAKYPELKDQLEAGARQLLLDDGNLHNEGDPFQGVALPSVNKGDTLIWHLEWEAQPGQKVVYEGTYHCTGDEEPGVDKVKISASEPAAAPPSSSGGDDQKP